MASAAANVEHLLFEHRGTAPELSKIFLILYALNFLAPLQTSVKHRCQFVDSHVTCRLKVEVLTLQDPGHTLHMLGALIVDNGLEQLSGYQCLAKEIHHGNPLVKNVYCINLQRLGFRVSSLHKAAWPKSMSLMTNGFRLATITFSNLMSYHFTRSIHIQGA